MPSKHQVRDQIDRLRKTIDELISTIDIRLQEIKEHIALNNMWEAQKDSHFIKVVLEVLNVISEHDNALFNRIKKVNHNLNILNAKIYQDESEKNGEFLDTGPGESESDYLDMDKKIKMMNPKKNPFFRKMTDGVSVIKVIEWLQLTNGWEYYVSSEKNHALVIGIETEYGEFDREEVKPYICRQAIGKDRLSQVAPPPDWQWIGEKDELSNDETEYENNEE